jgi:hypothetical protein
MHFYVHAKFMKLRMNVPHVIPEELIKWHIQILLHLAVAPFLISAMFEF